MPADDDTAVAPGPLARAGALYTAGMGHAGVRPLPVLRPGAWLRADERALVLTAGGVFAGASAGAAMAQAAADGLFLAEIGRDALGIALAISSAFLAIVLAIVGGLADRLDRRRVLGALAIGSATVLAGLAALVAVAPSAAAWITYLGGKQLAAATDLAFWVVIAERVDARRSQRLVPLLAAVGGAGAAVGALVVIPLAAVAGPRGVLLGAAAVIALAARGVTSLPARQRVGATPASLRALVVRSWTDGARAVGQSPLARHLALVVAIAGVFGSLAYTSLGFAIAPRGGSAGELASVFAIVRGAGQAITLAVQIAVAPRVLARLGTGKALLLAPLVAVAAAAGLVVAPVLALAIATQVSARVMDASIETPAEKLAQTLLPARVRGRVAGFLDGTAKRAGAAIGGLLAAMLAGAPAPFCATVAVVAVAWWLAARRISRELPRLAIEHVAGERIDEDERVLAAVDDRALAVLVAELASARPDRAADVLARLHAQGRVDARGPLVAVVTRGASPAVWRALLAVLDRPAEAYGAALQEAARAASPGTRALAIRAVGLAGGVPVEALASWRDHAEDDVALAAEVAAARLAGEDPLPGIAAASRTGQALSVVDELIAECGRGRDPERGLEAARHLVRAIRRGRGDAGARAEGLAMLADLVARAPLTSEVALLRSDLGELARERVDRAAPGGAAEVAAALRVLGAVSTDAEDLRRLGHALGEPDDDIRIAAERALAGLGPVAAGELIATAAWGRRRARDRAAALLADLPVTSLAIDRLVEGELAALDQTAAAVAVLRAPGDELISRRLAERLREIAHTVLLLLAAPRRSRGLADAARAWRHARGALERARTLAVIEAALPRAMTGRLVEAVDELAPADRAEAALRAGARLPTRDEVVRGELAGRDRLARALVLHALDRTGRSAHREILEEAARAEARTADPADFLRRLGESDPLEPEGENEMPGRIETLIVLGKVPLLAALTTRQLADVAERARWVTAKAGEVVVRAGDPLDALIVVEDGELARGARTIGTTEVVDELACFAPTAAAWDLVVTRAARMIRLERIDFEELVDDVPGLAAAVCRALGDRARRAADGG